MKYPMTQNTLESILSQSLVPAQASTPLRLIDRILSSIPYALAAPLIQLKKMELAKKRIEGYYELCQAAHTAILESVRELAVDGKLTPELQLYFYQLLQLYPI